MNYFYAILAAFMCAAQIQTSYSQQLFDHQLTGTGSQPMEMQLLTRLAAPLDVIQTCSPWLEQNQDIITTALGYEPMVGSVKPLMDATNSLLAQKNIKNLSNFNYVFCIPGTQYIVKIAGHVNRKHNLNTLYHYLQFPENPFGAEHYNYSRALKAEDYQLFAQKLADADYDHAMQNDTVVTMSQAPKTYQTISRAVNYLAFKNAQEKQNLSLVAAPETYLMHIPGRPTELSDRNYLIIEKRIDGLQRIEDISEQQGKDIDIAVKEANLFDYSKENMFVYGRNTIVFVDFEQPNNANPQQFLGKTRTVLSTLTVK